MYDSLIDSSTMTLSEKLAQLQDIASAPTRSQFAKTVGVNVVTLQRLSDRGDATDRILERIAGAFDGLDAETLRNDDLPLPPGVRLSTPAGRAVNNEESIHEGNRLRAYLDKHDIRQTELAEELKVHRVQVHYYLKTERFRPEVRKGIADALGQPEEVIFGSGKLNLIGSAQAPNVPLLGLPLLLAADRHQTAEKLLDYQRDFAPLTHPDRVFYVNSLVLRETPEVLADALAIEVTARDNMAPALQPGAIVLALRIAPDHWERITEGRVAVLADGELRIRQVYRNDLRTSDSLEVGTADVSRGGNVTLRRADVQALFQIVYILLSPA